VDLIEKTKSVSSLDIIAHYAGSVPVLLGQADVLDVCVSPDGDVGDRLGRGFEQPEQAY